MNTIALLTDYGARDHYAAAIKGVIVGMAPAARIIDITHEIEPFDVAGGAFVLWQAWTWFPSGTVFVAVVDPRVGSSRRIVIGRYGNRMVVAPDNGLLTWVHRGCRCEGLTIVENPAYFLPVVAPTFHGRDIIAPVAAHLACGVEATRFGPSTDRVEELPIPRRAVTDAGGWTASVLHVDRFGTLVTNFHADQLPTSGAPALEVTVHGTSIGGVRGAFHEVAVGSPLAMIGSSGFLEIAVNQSRAADRFGREARIHVHPGPLTVP